MEINLKVPEAQSRESRLGSITGYNGDLADLTSRGCSGCLQNRGRCLSSASSCTHLHGISLLIGIQGAIVVDHGPIGCSAGLIGFAGSRRSRRDGLRFPDSHVHSSNMNEADTVFGAVDKLKKSIRAAYERHHPKLIYVTTCCVSSIIGDDVYSVTQEMSAELGIPVGFGAMEGIKSKI
jgi:nitrogenase molybdenum-iron protein alpha chain